MHHAVTTRFILAVVLLVGTLGRGDAEELSAPQQRGRALAERMCAGCHAIGRTGQSPHIGAPPFRDLDRRIDLDGFIARLRDGLTSGHPDMPTFRFTRGDARAFVAYLRAIETP